MPTQFGDAVVNTAPRRTAFGDAVIDAPASGQGGRFVPDAPIPVAPASPYDFGPGSAAGQAAYQSDLARRNMRAAQEEQLNPEPNPFVQQGDAMVQGALQMGPPVIAGGLAAESGIGLLGISPIVGAASALGNRAAHAYSEMRGLSNPQTFKQAVGEDVNVGLLNAGMMAIPLPNAGSMIRSAGQNTLGVGLSPLVANPVRESITNVGVHALASAGVGASADAIYQAATEGTIDWNRVMMTGGVQGTIGALMSAHGAYSATKAQREGALEVARSMGLPARTWEEFSEAFQNNQRLNVKEAAAKQDAARRADPSVIDITETPAKAPVKALPEHVTNINERVAEKTPKQASKALREEAKLVEDPKAKAKLIDEADRLDRQVAANTAVADQQQAAVDARDGQQAVLDAQQKAVQKAQDDHQKLLLQEAKNRGEQIAATMEANTPPPQLRAQKPMVLATQAPEVANNIEANPESAQAQLSAAFPNLADNPNRPQAAKLAEPTVTLKPIPAVFGVEYLGKKHLVLDGIGEPMDQWQVKIPGEDPRGITMTADQIRSFGFEPPKVTKAERKTVDIEDDDAVERALAGTLKEPEPVAPKEAAFDPEDSRNFLSGMADKKADRSPLDQLRDLEDGLVRSGYSPVSSGFEASSPYMSIESPNNGPVWTKNKQGEFVKSADYEGGSAVTKNVPEEVRAWFHLREQVAAAAGSAQAPATHEEQPAYTPKPIQKQGVQKKSANVGRIVKMMGDKLYSADVSKTTGKELFQNAADAAMKNPDGTARSIYSGYSGDQFFIGDNGPGMTPDLIVDKFLPAGESGKSVGSAGGLGLAKIAILGGNKEWEVVTIARNPSGGFIKSNLKGTGLSYYDFIDNPPRVDLQPDTDIHLADGMTLRYEHLPEDDMQKTGTVVKVLTKDPEGANYFVKQASEYTPDIQRYVVRKMYDGENMDKHSVLSQAGLVSESLPDDPKPPMELMHTIATPFGTIDFIVPKGAKTVRSSYMYYNVLNRGILQFNTLISSREPMLLPNGFAVNIKPNVAAEDKMYPFTTNREEIIDSAQGAIDNYLKSLGQKAADVQTAKYDNAVRDAPKMQLNPGLVFLDAGGKVDPALMRDVTQSREVAVLTNDITKIQEGILRVLKRKYPGEQFGKAKFMGLLTGGESYGVHFGRPGAKETGIYHDPFLVWRDASDEALSFLQHEFDEQDHSGFSSTDSGRLARDEYVQSQLPATTYEFWRSTTAGIALHEALHQTIRSEGEDLARGLTFKAGDILEPVLALTDQVNTPEEYANINNAITNFGQQLASQSSREEAGNLIVSQGGYSGYALRDAGGKQQGAGQPEAGFVAPEEDKARLAVQAQTQAQQAGSLPSGWPKPIGYGTSGGDAPPPDNKEARRAGSFRRQQRGAADPDVLRAVAGSALGGTFGYLTAKKRDDETDEQFQVRRAINTLIWASAGGLGVPAYRRVFFTPKAAREAAALRRIQLAAKGLDSMPEWYSKFRRSTYFGKISLPKIREGHYNARTIVKDMVGDAALAGHEIPAGANAYAVGKAAPGMEHEAHRKADVVAIGIEKHLVAVAKHSPLSVDDFIGSYNAWLEARHTPFYNLQREQEHIAAGRPGNPPTGKLTNAEATAILNQANADGLEPVFKDLAKSYKRIVDVTRDLLEGEGLIAPEDRKFLETNFPEYVPLNRIMPGAEFDEAMQQHLGGGAGVSVRGAGIRRARGTDLDADDIGGNLLANWHDAIARVEHNKVAKAGGHFFQNLEFDGTPVPGVKVGPPELFTQKDKATGREVTKPEVWNPATMMSYMVKGKPVWVRFKDPLMAAAFSNTNTETVPTVLRLIGKLTRPISRLATGYSFNFIVPNMPRDRQSAAVKSLSQGDIVGAAQQMSPRKMLQDTLAVIDWVSGKSTPGAALFQEVLDNGGMPGGGFDNTRERAQDAVQLARQAESNPLVKGKEAVQHFFHLMSDISEGGARLNNYRRALEIGATIPEAVVNALDSSVDFGQKGTYSPSIGTLKAFYNPTVQGTVGGVKNIIRSKDAAVVLVTGLMGFQAMVNQWNGHVYPEWRRLPGMNWARTNSVPILYKDGDEVKFFKTPLSQELRPLKAMLDFVVDYGNGEIRPGDNLESEAGRVAGAIANGANPLGGEALSNPADVITAFAPLADIQQNRDYGDRPIVPDEQHFDRNIQDQAKLNGRLLDARTGRAAKALTDFLHNKFDINISPSRAMYLVRSYGGGPVRMTESAINSVGAPKEELKASDIPGGLFGSVPKQGIERNSKEYRQAEQALSESATKEQEIRTQSKLFFRHTFDKIPFEQWPDAFRKASDAGLIPDDPVFRKQLFNDVIDKVKGRGDVDKLVAQFGEENGERAAYYASLKRDFKTDDEYHQYLLSQTTGISPLLTVKIIQQLPKYLEQQK